MSQSWKNEPSFPSSNGPDDLVAPVAGSVQPAVSPTAEAYAAARAALAAEMVGPLFGRGVEPEIEPVAAQPVAPEPALQTPAVPVSQVTVTSPAAWPPRPDRRTQEPKRRRGLVIVAGALITGALVLAMETLPPMLRPPSDPAAVAAADPSGSATDPDASASEAMLLDDTPSPSPTASPTPTPTPKPTAKPTVRKPAATRRPTARPTAKPVVLSAKWATDPPVPPQFRVKTLAGAVCHVTRVSVSSGTSRTSSNFTANSTGLAVLTWALTPGRTYDVTATCTLNGKSASTATRRIST
jgi:hypothetical protein